MLSHGRLSGQHSQASMFRVLDSVKLCQILSSSGATRGGRGDLIEDSLRMELPVVG